MHAPGKIGNREILTVPNETFGEEKKLLLTVNIKMFSTQIIIKTFLKQSGCWLSAHILLSSQSDCFPRTTQHKPTEAHVIRNGLNRAKAHQQQRPPRYNFLCPAVNANRDIQKAIKLA